jgi:hypothetical protein
MRSLIAVAMLATSLQAGTVLFDRPLPVDNLNNAAGSNRSNVAWADVPGDNTTFNWSYGDDFTLGTTGQSFSVSSLTLWVIGDSAHSSFNSIFSSLSLLGGPIGSTTSNSGACSEMTSGAFPCLNASGIGNISTVDTAGSDANVAISQVTYNGGLNYQSVSGTDRNIYQVTFQNLNWAIDGGTDYAFFLTGVPGTVGNGGVSPYLSASNAARSGNTQEGADDLLWELAQNGSSAVAMEQWDSAVIGWDKSSDINVQISGTDVTPTPEPATLGMLAAGLAALGIARRRKA